ncbi:hypothetical protein [Bradyrhizobium sp.]|uniref:hypothetical protein n=1 Tax=Bradyrhizobium sp. TaxID=376 RepID=UPI002D46764F|nr:hypothetical protein [Bradyrhizobium sp.]
MREFALGHEALRRFVGREPLRRVHECVLAVLALEASRSTRGSESVSMPRVIRASLARDQASDRDTFAFGNGTAKLSLDRQNISFILK